ncbi:cupin [Kocuria sp. M1R5S2]|uniref:cupin n=1 Tax=Kocuria rhizosphaerae TaxID=3376285 RepID=UPI00379E6628
MLHLDDLAAANLERAHAAVGGNSAELVIRDGVLRQTVIALCAGRELAEHVSPPAATLQMLRGRIRVLKRGQLTEELVAGELLSLTDSRHSVEALEDSVFLLTSVSRPSDGSNPRVA